MDQMLLPYNSRQLTFILFNTFFQVPLVSTVQKVLMGSYGCLLNSASLNNFAFCKETLAKILQYFASPSKGYASYIKLLEKLY